MIGETVITYDDELVEHVAWKLAEEDGFSYGRCAIITQYEQRVRDILVAVEVAAEQRAAGRWE